MSLKQAAKKSMVLFSIVTGLILLSQTAKANAEELTSLDFDLSEYSLAYSGLDINVTLTKDDLIKLRCYHRTNAILNYHRAVDKALCLSNSIDLQIAMEAFKFAMLNSPDSSSYTKVPEITLMRLQEYGLLSNDALYEIQALLQIAKFHDDLSTIFENVQ